mgnify:CR=1 FL=1
MASILKVDEMQGVTSAGDITITSEGGSATMQLQNGVLKAWRKYDTNSSTTETDSFNYSSIADNGTGETTHTLTSAMVNTTYTIMHNTQFSTFSGVKNSVASTTTTHRTGIYNASNAPVDVDQCFIHIAGDLA